MGEEGVGGRGRDRGGRRQKLRRVTIHNSGICHCLESGLLKLTE